MTDLFFYGTLCHAPLLAAVLGRVAEVEPASLPGHEVLWSADGPWPVIRAAVGASAEGVLLRGASAEDVARLDFYEGGFGYGARELPLPQGRALAPVLHAHPQLRLHLVLDDAHTDLVTERIDLAIRLGKLPDSSWVARPLGSLPWWLCAAPALLAGAAGLPAAGKRKAAKASAKMQPPISQPAQLQALPWVMREAGVTGASPSTGAPGALAAQAAGATQPGQAVWLQRGDERQAINPVPRVRCTQQLAVQQLCLDGLGVAQLFSLDVAELVARGELLRLLPDWDCGQLAIWALTPDRQALPARVRVALKAIQAHFAQVAV